MAACAHSGRAVQRRRSPDAWRNPGKSRGEQHVAYTGTRMDALDSPDIQTESTGPKTAMSRERWKTLTCSEDVRGRCSISNPYQQGTWITFATVQSGAQDIHKLGNRNVGTHLIVESDTVFQHAIHLLSTTTSKRGETSGDTRHMNT